ncbi:MAG: UDP-N-acetylmuramate dehydrogenase [Deltaproteobacteria bacterium]|nr:UDP-N-acetylmuramate dehydrogenase [Deltaproteobacteria bacterium]MBW2047161.1 UDP-N-acetylmuramate dehydrogenase [Deltaproteobacteria bacterium]MBW2109838.1 UDP-N-acetylmuramate dehydrogenase [Deltaproteobacteria bacterium]MBW2352548.1 UDP-N-acetylmuramate dehydrogenase [Deltaproteobacteria bacterium]
MDEQQKLRLRQIAGPRIRFHVPMDRHTTFKAGGSAEALYRTGDPEELERVITFLEKEGIPRLVAGRGSNLLVRDGGIRGVVILLADGVFKRIEGPGTDGEELLAGAGVSLSDLLIYCRDRGLSGLEFLAGIPGTVGGAVIMNAGAFGKETGPLVREVKTVDRSGHPSEMDASMLRFSYRSLDLEPGTVITQVLFHLYRDSPERISQRIAEFLRRRRETQPSGYGSAGSIFKNPPGNHAGRLIEEAGLKGRSMGGAMISDKHANFIVNLGGATASDIISLIRLAREEVRKKSGVLLELEIQIVGEPQDQKV